MPRREDTREFLIGYFSHNNIEMDILRVIFSAQYRGNSSNFEKLKEQTIFRFIDTNLLDKLKYHKFIYFREKNILLSSRGIIAILHIFNTILEILQSKQYTQEELAKVLSKNGLSFGGRSKDSEIHKKLLSKILNSLVETGLISLNDKTYSQNHYSSRMNVGIKILSAFYSSFRFNSRTQLEEVISLIAKLLKIKKFQLNYVMINIDEHTKKEIKKILGVQDSSDYLLSLEKIISRKLNELIAKKIGSQPQHIGNSKQKFTKKGVKITKKTFAMLEHTLP